MINIEISQDEEGKVELKIDGNQYQFNFDGFETIIELALQSKEINFTISNDNLNEYKVLLEDIVNGVKQNDFKDAVAKAKQDKLSLEDLEKEYSKTKM